ncbi:uncharacterized protein C2845_PM07G07680 [Panicum miliaceum]|uniref:Uncharacterized protein n=1 Tax=Panicum miliaceum TaxID=4540 RepID=A0A3L6SMC9_PANMI|nr:uncharacterized protein C2845_PM07G07680 [Panicum miliaceum]
MEVNEVRDQDTSVDLEKGNCLPPREDNNGMKINTIAGNAETKLHGSWDDLVALKEDKSHHISCCSSHCQDSVVKCGESMTSEGEIKVGLLDKAAGNKEKKKWSKKPPRPPRPPTASPLDPADQKLISELSELALLKRARIERMKALKKMKNSKPASSIGNLFYKKNLTAVSTRSSSADLRCDTPFFVILHDILLLTVMLKLVAASQLCPDVPMKWKVYPTYSLPSKVPQS